MGRGRCGADDRDRTGDLVLTKDALCLLSYIGTTRDIYCSALSVLVTRFAGEAAFAHVVGPSWPAQPLPVLTRPSAFAFDDTNRRTLRRDSLRT